MKLELSDQQAQAVRQGQPVEIIDPATKGAYLVVARETFEGLRAAAGRGQSERVDDRSTPPGVQRSQAAFLRDVPELLKKKHDRWFALYQGDACVRIARRYEDLLRECRRRGIGRDACYIGVIRHHEPTPEEIEHLPGEYDEVGAGEP
jgi:hypothetical protein